MEKKLPKSIFINEVFFFFLTFHIKRGNIIKTYFFIE